MGGCPRAWVPDSVAWLWEGSVDQEMCVQSGLDRCHGGEGSQETSLLSSPRPKNGFTGDKGVRQKQTWSSCEDRGCVLLTPDRGGSPATSEQTGCPSDVRGLCLWDLRHLGQSLVCFLWAAGLQGQRRRAELIWRGSSRPPVRPWWGEQGQGGQVLEKVFLWGREGGKEAPPPRPCLLQQKNAGPNSFVFGGD